MGGVYMIFIKEKKYIGQDSKIHSRKRIREHLNMLKNGNHFNADMQKDFDEHGEDAFGYKVLKKEIPVGKLDEYEKKYIEKYNTFNSDTGYNLTKGGVGMWGYRQSEELRTRRSASISGEKNPMAKLTDSDFYEIVELLLGGKTNSEIAEQYNIHSRYVSLIRHKRRFKHLWDKLGNINIPKSNGRYRGLSYEEFLNVVNLIEEGNTNKSIEQEFDLSHGTVSKIKHKKLYKEYWCKKESEKERSTTIENQ